MTNNVTRAFAILEELSPRAEGMHLQDIAGALSIPASAVHRHLAELTDMGYVRPSERQGGAYVATTKLVSLGFSILAARGIVDLAQPILERLAVISGELVRLGVCDEDRLTFVARAQGARGGLIYDGDMGQAPILFASASGLAWLSCVSDEEALRIIHKQGLGPPGAIAANTPKTTKEVLQRLAQARTAGYGIAIESANPGTNAIAVAVRDPRGSILGTISIAGPSIRMTEPRLLALVKPMQEAAVELASARAGSPALKSGSGWILKDDPRIHGDAPKPAKKVAATARNLRKA